MSGIPSLTLLSEEQKFNGDNLLQWKTNITQLLASKGLLGYVEGKIAKPTQTPTPPSDKDTPTSQTVTPIYSTTPTYDEWNFRDHLARGHITLNCTDVAGLGVVTTGTSKEAWDSIQNEWGKSTDMRRSHAQEALNRTMFTEGANIQEHIKLLRIRKIAVDNLSNIQMGDEACRGIIIRSIPPTAKWLPVIPSLYAMPASSDVISTLLVHGMILGRDTKPSTSTNSSSTALAATSRTVDGPGCTNPLCKAKNKKTHMTRNCYWPGGGKEGQFPPNFGQRSKANIASSTNTSLSSTTTPAPTSTSTSTPTSTPAPTTACASCAHSSNTEHFALSVIAPEAPGQSGVLVKSVPNDAPAAFITQGFRNFQKGKVPTFMDSGASDTMFVSKEAFTEYKPITPRKGDSAKAVDGSFDIIGEGSVIQRYHVDGRTLEVTYTHALHTPTLNANLVSVSACDRAGLITTFGGGKGVTRQSDGTIVLNGKNVNGMYLLDALEHTNNIVPRPIAMGSLTQQVSLEQWHRRLTHCSPSTIQEMANNKLVDGLIISNSTLTGKCEDCIMGRQTRRPFDGTTETKLHPLDLVSFDLWGPSRV